MTSFSCAVVLELRARTVENGTPCMDGERMPVEIHDAHVVRKAALRRVFDQRVAGERDRLEQSVDVVTCCPANRTSVVHARSFYHEFCVGDVASCVTRP